MHKLKNILKHKTDPTLEFNFDFKLEMKPFDDSVEQTFKEHIRSSHNENLPIEIIWKTSFRPLESKFQLIREDFEKVDMNQVKDEYKNFELDKLDYKGSSDALRAKHLVRLDNETKKDVFVLEVLHLIQKEWSGLRILRDGQLKASSNFIGIAQLPIIEQIGSSSTKGLSLAKFEKAMLVKNVNGDYAIVKGKWTGLKKKTTVNGENKPGDPGKLSIMYYSFVEETLVRLNIPKSFVFEIRSKSILAIVDLKTGRIVFKYKNVEIDPLEVESLLALISSISTLHVFLQPKAKRNSKPFTETSEKESTETSIKKSTETADVISKNGKKTFTGKRRNSSVYNPYDDYYYLYMMGYYDILCCDSLICHCDEDHPKCHDDEDYCDNNSWVFSETHVSNVVSDF